MARLVRVPNSSITNVNLAPVDFAVYRLSCELLEAEVNGRIDQRHATELHVTAGEDLASDRACRTDDQI